MITESLHLYLPKSSFLTIWPMSGSDEFSSMREEVKLMTIKLRIKDGRYVMVGGSLSQIFKSLVFGWALSLGSKKIKSLSA